MGGLLLHIQGCLFDSEAWYKVKYMPSSIPVMNDTGSGKKLRYEGWTPDIPIFLVPGN